MNIKPYLSVLFFSVIFLETTAQKKVQPPVKRAPTKVIAAKKPAVVAATPHTLLWKISGNGLRQPSYLFGTMHILCAGEIKLSDALQQVIDSSNRVYFEIDMDDMTQLMGALKYVRMNGDKKLSDLLTPEEYAKVENYFKQSKTPMPLSMLNRFKPYVVSSLISEQMMACEKTNGMEQMIMEKASEKSKPIEGLETAEFQAGLFDSIPYEKQAKDLVGYIDSIDSYKKVTRELVDVYRAQDLQRMDSLMLKSDPGMEEYMDLLLYGRNRKWARAMSFIMKEGTMLFAVGAGHLTGTQGLISLLRQQGYVVSPVPNKWQVP